MTILEVEQLEERMRRAMLAGDLAALDDLVSERLRFVAPDGANLDKQTDLAAHRSGTLRLVQLDAQERHSELCGDVALVNVAMAVEGNFAGQDFRGRFRYTRVWHRQGERTRIIAGQMCAIQDQPA